MPQKVLAALLIVVIVPIGLAVLSQKASDAAREQPVGRETGLPLPRFVSLKSDPANVRRGPGLDYAIKWIFRRPSVPLEIIAEFDNWRKIRDFDGATGWIHRALVGSARTAWIAPWESAQTFALRSDPKPEASALAIIEPKVLVRVNHCSEAWCNITKQGHDGYIRQRNLWGVYLNETIAHRSIF